jgi:hypothetical protein|tara:strand:- start:1621 stop:1836 length:216 start_codon:yes stop_codon:yes gene_type:complete
MNADEANRKMRANAAVKREGQRTDAKFFIPMTTSQKMKKTADENKRGAATGYSKGGVVKSTGKLNTNIKGC